MENKSQIIIYTTEKGETKLEVRLENETVWLNQKLMAELFQTTKQNISLHLQNVFEEGELNEDSVVKDFLTAATHSMGVEVAPPIPGSPSDMPTH